MYQGSGCDGIEDIVDGNGYAELPYQLAQQKLME